MTMDFLAEYDAAPDVEKYPLVRKWIKTNPLPFFKQLRAERPILVTPECTLLARSSDVRDCLQMPTIFSVDLYKSKMGVTDDNPGYLMAHDDDALHYREKSIMQSMLNRDDIPRIKKLISDTSKKILDDADGQIEIVNNYCRMVPVILVQKYFGFDGIEPEALFKWSYWNQYNTFYNQPFDLNPKDKHDHIVQRHEECTAELTEYLKAMILRKLFAVKVKDRVLKPALKIKNAVRGLIGKEPEVHEDDIVTRMLRSSFPDEVDFPLIRLGRNVGGLLIGTVETTSKAAAQVIHFFLERPELLAQAKAASLLEDTDEIESLVWEALRFVPIGAYMFRQVAQDYIIAEGTEYETSLKKGTRVLALTQSAMFDECAYKNADEFNKDRNWYNNFTYGFGAHDCLGKYIGMAMLPEMVRQVLALDGVHAVSTMDFKDGPFPEHYELVWNK